MEFPKCFSFYLHCKSWRSISENEFSIQSVCKLVLRPRMIVITLIAYLAKSMIFNPYTLYINGMLVHRCITIWHEIWVWSVQFGSYKFFFRKNYCIEEYTNAYKSYIKKFTRAFLQYTCTIVNIQSQWYFPWKVGLAYIFEILWE